MTYTNGYTIAKRNAHIVSLAVIAVLGAVLVGIAYWNTFVRVAAVVVGVILLVVGLGGMVPVIQRPTVEGTAIV